MKNEENPYAPPRDDVSWAEFEAGQPNKAWRNRETLVVCKGAELPDRCLKCNAPAAGYRFRRDLAWLHPNWVLVFLISPILYVLVYLILRKRGTVTVGVCARHREIRTRAILWGCGLSLAGLGSVIATAGVPENLVPFSVLGGIVLLLVGLITGAFGSRILVPKRIDKHFIHLTKVSPDYLATWPEWRAAT